MKTIVEIHFDAGRIPGGADTILGPSQCGSDVAKRKEYRINTRFEQRSGTNVELTLEDSDARVSKVLALLAEHGKEPWVSRYDVYTEDELQAAPLLVLSALSPDRPSGGPAYGTTYDLSKACNTCGSGARQTSPLIIDRAGLKAMEKFRVAETTYGDILVRDVDVEKLLAAGVTGALFWPVYAKAKGGDLEELRWQQVFIEHVLPPMSPKTLLDRSQVCPECKRGCFTHLSDYPVRDVYRREDLANIRDFNLSAEWFGSLPHHVEALGMVSGARSPIVLVTPKVMNLLRGKTKKEAKHQGCEFTPIWIEENGAIHLAT